ncbi:hypothetical protein G3570_02120 [Balneolaceae bacterium YR4-1]|uniref:GDSL-like Lipase/Acylhydrolase n=1 Tax=Halalkalibaculum roseum TaxID=2709311 RepID=A0A6M1SRN7_9BACT|nr:hypothetical protein [Halalkalibaculum roseum]NGP75412.1 hypothetical protein [Halalkalibaculum roseum]
MARTKKPKHKLAVVGDSITQGFQNGGIYRTDINFPAFLNQCFEPEPQFDQPLFTAQGGIPLNLEVLVRGLSDEFGSTLEWNEYLPAMHHLYTTLRRVKNYWEGNIKDLKRDHHTPYHNQSVWGFSISDAWKVTELKSRELIEKQSETYSVFNVLPDHAMYTTARLTLNPTLGQKFSNNTLLDNVKHLQENGGIENLIATMGHNNVIGAVTDLRFNYSEDDNLESFPSERNFTVYRPEHFEMEYRKFAEKVSQIGAERVITQTIPYVTIPPVTRGVNEDRSIKDTTYFDYYTRFWIWDSDFDPERHPYLTREQAIKLDRHVDNYNNVIREVADEYGWITVPLNKYVSAIARRRRKGGITIPYPEDFIQALKANEATSHLVDENGNPGISTDYLRLDNETGKVYQGGIFSLDGIHPTTIGYGLIAHVYYETMEHHGVKFQKPLDWNNIINNDSLVTNPPYLLVELRNLLRFLSMGRQERFLRIGTGLLQQLMETFTQQNVSAAEEE